MHVPRRFTGRIRPSPATPRNMRTTTQRRLRIQPRRPRGRPKTEDLEALEARLVSVALQAFVLHGYGTTSINAIARSARVSKNTLYARFPSKAALFQAIVAQQIATVDEEVPASGGSDESLEDQLRAYVGVALRRSLSKEAIDINRLILAESYQFPELGEASRARFQIGLEHVARSIQECARRDRVPCRNPTAAAELFLSAMYGWYISVIVSNRQVTDRERNAWVDNAIRMFLASRSSW
jgi:TetR/AcrR family transcriptional regulator, mexJK operon transcriptional repressor